MHMRYRIQYRNECKAYSWLRKNELRSTAGTGYTYVTKKNRRNDPDRIVLSKYDPVVRKHVDFREER